MAVTLDLPDDAVERLQAEADRRGVTVDELVAELAARLPAEGPGEVPARRRRLAISGVGASGGNRGRAADADELLADGFGRS